MPPQRQAVQRWLQFNFKVVTYLDWFKNTFKIDQTSLIRNLLRTNTSSLNKSNCYEYYISKFDIYLSSEEEKLNLLQKHTDAIEREKRVLWEIAKTQSNYVSSSDTFDDDTLKTVKECLQEIEIQNEILRRINENIHLHFENCQWHPFQDNTLFDTFLVLRLPLLKLNTNYWLGILPDKFNSVVQNNFFTLLQNRTLPEHPSLILTKLGTWVRIEYQHTPEYSVVTQDRTVNSTLFQEKITYFRTKERALARQKIMDNWEAIYKPMHEREH